MDNVGEMLREIIAELLDELRDRTEFELVSSFSYRLPYRLTCYRMGIPKADWDRCGEWTAMIERIVDPGATSELLRDCSVHVDEMETYFKALLAERRQDPGDDLITYIATMDYNGERLSDSEAVATIAFIFLAGQGSTVLQTVNGILALIQHPDQMDLLRQHPSLTKPAVDEILRFEAPSQFSTRFATEDRTYSETTIPAGQLIMPSLAAASRDPEVYPAPDRLDIQRPSSRIPAFGQGSHLCLGATVARMIGEMAIRALLDNFDPIELAMKPDDIVYNSIMARGPSELYLSVGHVSHT
jgi:cytochrome P450